MQLKFHLSLNFLLETLGFIGFDTFLANETSIEIVKGVTSFRNILRKLLTYTYFYNLNE